MNIIEQRRHLALLFCDLVDSTRIAAGMEPEEFGDLLSAIRQCTYRVVESHGGQIARIDGDGCLCLFGYPEAFEDAGRRATEAALDLHAAVAAIPPPRGTGQRPLLLHSGIHAGAVLLRSGDMVRGRFEMLGDATNVAARLCDAAEPGSILVSADTLGPDHHFFVTAKAGDLAVSGHVTALPALFVRGRRAVPHRFAARTRDGLSPFVGRGQECERLFAWLSDEHAAPVLLVSGPAGIGKSRFATQVAADAAGLGWRVGRGYCESYRGGQPLQPFRQIVAGLTATHEADAAPATSDLLDRLRLVACSAPLLLLIDDWQWRDDASTDLLLALLDEAAAGGRVQVRIVLASREVYPGPLSDRDWIGLPLQPLDDDSVRATVSTLLPASDMSMASRIITASGGSPLLVEELCHAFASGETEPEAAPRGAWFDFTVQSRFSQLASVDADVLRHAAVIGHVVPAWLLAAAIGRQLDGSVLDRLQQADFLFRGDDPANLRFKHGLTRDAVYAGIGRKERLALHRRIAEAAPEAKNTHPVEPQLMARHLAASEQPAAALPWWLKAGDAALAAGSLDRAEFHFGAAFDWLDRDGLDTDELKALRHVIRRFGRACVVDPSREHVPLLYRMKARAEALGDIEARALATYWIGAHYYGLGEPRRSLAALTEAMDAAAPLGSPSFHTQIRANLGQSNAIAARYADAMHHMDAAIAAKQAARETGKPSSSLAYCLSSRGLVKADMGRFAAAEADFEAAVAALEGSDDAILPSLVTQNCLALIYQGKFSEAADRAEWSEQRAGVSRSRFLILSARALGSYARWLDTSRQDWFERFAQAMLTLHRSQSFQRISYKYGWMAETMADRGEAAMARTFAALAFRRALKGDRLGEASAARGMAVLAARGMTTRSPDHYLAMAARAAHLRHSPREAALNRLCAARCLALAGRAPDAAVALADAQTALDAIGAGRWAAMADRAVTPPV